MGSTIIQIISTFITAAGAVVVALIANSERKSRKLRETEAKLAAKEKAEEKKELEDQIDEIRKMMKALDKKVDGIESNMSDISQQVREMRDLDDDVKSDLKTIRQQHERRAIYLHRLADVVLTMAVGLRDNHLDGNITTAVNSFREYERNQLAESMGAGSLASEAVVSHDQNRYL